MKNQQTPNKEPRPLRNDSGEMEELPSVGHTEPLIDGLHRVIRILVRILAILMTLVIMWGVADVTYVLYHRVLEPPVGLLDVTDILATFGAFMAVLIAIEIFVNIALYLREDVLHVKLVLATALMAVARKAIVLDYDTIAAEYVWATAGSILALSISFWLVTRNP